MTQRDVVCELEILTENDNNRIVIRLELPCLFLVIFSSSVSSSLLSLHTGDTGVQEQASLANTICPFSWPFILAGGREWVVLHCCNVCSREIIVHIHNILSFLLRHKTETDEPVLRLCASRHSESVVVELINGNLFRYTSGT